MSFSKNDDVCGEWNYIYESEDDENVEEEQEENSIEFYRRVCDGSDEVDEEVNKELRGFAS